jgi:hypothetical protein
MSAMAEAAPAKLPLWRTIGESFAAWFQNLPELFRIAWIWLLVMAPIIFLFMWWQAPAMMEMMQNARAGRPDPNPGMTLLTQALNGLILMPILSSIAVAWHRLLLRGEHVSGSYFRLDSVVIGYAVLLFVLALFPSVPSYLGQIYVAMTQRPGAFEIDAGALVVSSLCSIVALVVLIFACRLFMVLPAKALGREISFGEAWAATRKNTWRLFWGYMICLLPLAVIAGGFGFWLMFAQPSRVVTASFWTVLTLLWAVYGMVGVGFLSLAYRFFFERPA